MNILALETSTRKYSLALEIDGKVVAQKTFQLKKLLSAKVMPAIKVMLKEHGLKLEDIDAYAVGLGPGSFTGLRVGISTVKALAYGGGRPVVGISSLDVIARGAKASERHICVICDAKRGNVYSACYEAGEALRKIGEDMLSDLQTALAQVKGETLFVGDGALLYQKEIIAFCRAQKITCAFADEKFNHPKAGNIFPLVRRKIKRAGRQSVFRLKPVYLYPEDCQVRR